jgi:hypothetical protein
VSGLLFIDGGYPVQAPPGTTFEELFELLLKPSLARLERMWSSEEEYLDFWRGQPTFRPEDWSPCWEAYLRNDLGGEAPRPECKPYYPAVKADWFNMADREAAGERIRRTSVPIRIITAEYGVMWGADPGPDRGERRGRVAACRRTSSSGADPRKPSAKHGEGEEALERG